MDLVFAGVVGQAYGDPVTVRGQVLEVDGGVFVVDEGSEVKMTSSGGSTPQASSGVVGGSVNMVKTRRSSEVRTVRDKLDWLRRETVTWALRARISSTCCGSSGKGRTSMLFMVLSHC